eukprot:gene18038-biopygen6017
MASCSWMQDGVVILELLPIECGRFTNKSGARSASGKMRFETLAKWLEWDFRITCGAASKGTLGIVQALCKVVATCCRREGTGKVQAGTMTLAEHKHVPSMALAAQVAWRVQGKVLRLYRAISMTVVRQCVPVLQNAAPWDRPRPAVGAAQWGWKATSSESRAAWDRQLSS